MEAEDVLAFRREFGQLISERPVHLTQRRLAERTNFLLDELNEFAEGAGLELKDGRYVVTEDTCQDLAEQADALVDIVYVALGTAIMLGLPWYPLWHDVHAANMRKVLGPTGDVIKPPGWVGPRTEEILYEHGYNMADETLIDDPEHSR